METETAGWSLIVQRVVESAALLLVLIVLVFSP
jgi:hypothetical protein